MFPAVVRTPEGHRNLIASGGGNTFLGFTNQVRAIGVGVFTPLVIDIVNLSSSLFTHAAPSGNVTVNVEGRYEVTFVGSGFQAAGAARSTAAWALFHDQGAGAVFQFGAAAFSYHRDAANGFGSCSATWTLDLSAGDILSVQATRIGGLGVISFFPFACTVGIRATEGLS